MQMDNIIDFSTVRKERQTKQIAEFLKRPNSLSDMQEIDRLVGDKQLSLEDHQFFLGYLGALEKEEIDPVDLFHSLIKLSKYQFELAYPMNWYTVVEICFIFLAILKKNEPDQYQKFMELQVEE